MFERLLIESTSSRSTRLETRALPRVPGAVTRPPRPLDQPRLNSPPSESTVEDDGHYTDIHNTSDTAGARSSLASAGTRTSYWLVDDPYHYIDIDRLNTGDQSVSSRGYEGLHQAVLPTLDQSHRPAGHYAGLVGAASAAEQIEMTDVDVGNVVSHLLSSVGIDLKELGEGGQPPKCLKFCPGIEI